jgi:hypothetical protein
MTKPFPAASCNRQKRLFLILLHALSLLCIYSCISVCAACISDTTVLAQLFAPHRLDSFSSGCTPSPCHVFMHACMLVCTLRICAYACMYLYMYASTFSYTRARAYMARPHAYVRMYLLIQTCQRIHGAYMTLSSSPLVPLRCNDGAAFSRGSLSDVPNI